MKGFVSERHCKTHMIVIAIEDPFHQPDGQVATRSKTEIVRSWQSGTSTSQAKKKRGHGWKMWTEEKMKGGRRREEVGSVKWESGGRRYRETTFLTLRGVQMEWYSIPLRNKCLINKGFKERVDHHWSAGRNPTSNKVDFLPIPAPPCPQHELG